jgi:Sulfotransferase family
MFDYERLHTAVSTLRQKQIFFIGGTPKSGSTWLQLLLNAHPSVSCSGEGHFPDHLWEVLKQTVDKHCQSIQNHNKQLFNGAWGYPRLTDEDFHYIFGSCIAVFLIEQSRDKIARAIGDKTPANVRYFAELASLFPTAKFIQIVRDGRDCAVSGWFQNLRIPDWVKYNGGSLEIYVARFAERWAADLARAQEFADRHPDRILRIRYEDLRTDTECILTRVFEFLGVEAGETVLAQCRTEAAFAKWSGGRHPGEENRLSFFRKGVAGDWRNHLSEEANTLFRERAGIWLNRLGYAIN